MKLQFLGVGSAFSAYALGETSAIIYNKEPTDGFILLDCGVTAIYELQKRNLLSELKGILITHVHSDHCGGIELAAFYSYFVMKKKLTVYVYSEKIEKQLWDMFKHSMSQIQDSDGNPVTATKETYFNFVILDSLQFRSAKLSMFKVPHVPNKLSCGIKIETLEGGTSIYTGDINKPIWEIDSHDFTYEGISKYKYIFHDAQLFDGGKGAVHAFVGDLKEDSDSLSLDTKRKLILMHYGKPQTQEEIQSAREWCGGFADTKTIFDI